jgi:pimeloyl-ACP methyl ester carboxylesterase
MQTQVQAPPRRRRWLRVTLIVVLALAVVVVAATAGIGFYFSSALLNVDNSISYPLEVKAVDGNQVTLTRNADADRPVVEGLWWDGGSALLTNTVTISGDTVRRTVASVVHGSLVAGLHVTADIRMYDGNPSARGLKFDPVSVPGELGAMPAWFVPPTTTTASTTWVIAVHGRRGTMTEPLRILPTLAATGHPTLVISYRNDPDTPHSPDNFYHLGDSEWKDVQSAIAYARSHGATGVVLYAWSMGGTLSVTALRRMAPADVSFVHAVVLDSPAIDWTSILDLQGAQRGLPGFIIWTAERVIEWRAGFSLSDVDVRPYAPQLAVPTLIFLDTSDGTVPNGPTLDFVAAARPGIVTLVTTTGGDHTGSWNVDPSVYESTVTHFLSGI